VKTLILLAFLGLAGCKPSEDNTPDRSDPFPPPTEELSVVRPLALHTLRDGSFLLVVARRTDL
jgi:hypothetical protein